MMTSYLSLGFVFSLSSIWFFRHHPALTSSTREHGSSELGGLSALTVSGTQDVKAGGPLPLWVSHLEAYFYFALPSRKIIFHDTETKALLSSWVEVLSSSVFLRKVFTLSLKRGSGLPCSLALIGQQSPQDWPQYFSPALIAGVFRTSWLGS